MVGKEVAISRINNIEDQIQQKWNEFNKNELRILSEAWKDASTNEYIQKVQGINDDIKNIISKLEEFKSYWQYYNENEETTDKK